MHKIIIIIFVTLCHLSSQNIFTLNYHREDWRIIKESVNLYNTSDKLFIEINTYSPYILINHSKEAIKSNVIIGLNTSFSCSLIELPMTYDNIQISNYTYVIQYDKVLHFFEGIGLGYHIEHNESLTFIHQLYEQYHFDHMKFVLEDHYPKGCIHFGGVPNDAHLSFPYKGVIKVDESLPTWGFDINQIEFDNIKHQVHFPTIMLIGSPSMFIGNDFMDYMKEVILTKCIGGDGTIQCDDDIVYSNNTINFVFGEQKIHIRLKDLFEFKRAKISQYYFWWDYKFNETILGFEFVELFNYTIFDYENKQIEFYSDRIVIQSNISHANIKVSLIINNVIILSSVLNIILLIFMKYRLIN